jgi:hypothetical protein
VSLEKRARRLRIAEADFIQETRKHGLQSDVQLGKMGNILFSVDLNAHGVDSGMENANKTVSHFGWCVNGGFLEG